MKICKDKLKKARTAANLTHEQLATAGDVSVRTIQNYEHKGGDVNLHILKAMAKKMHVDPQSLAISK